MRTFHKPPMTRVACMTLLALWALSGCDDKDARAAWTDVLSKCATIDTMGQNVLFLGPSNKIGAGAVWRKTTDGGYNVRWLLTNVDPDGTWQQRVITQGATATCTGNHKSTWSLKPSLLLESRVAPISAELAADLNQARDVAVWVNSWTIDQIVEGPYEELLGEAPSAVADDLIAGNRYVAVKAVRVSGLVSELNFNSSDAVVLKGKYPIAQLPLGDLGATLEAKWTSDTTLQVTSKDDFVIVTELSALERKAKPPGRFPASGGISYALGPARVDPNAMLGVDLHDGRVP